MRKTVVLILLGIFLTKVDFVLAQFQPYFSIKKGWEGFVVGVEIIDQKTQKTIDPNSYSYEWFFPVISIDKFKSKNNLFFVKLEKVFSDLQINLKIKKILAKEIYALESKVDLPAPIVKIVKKHKGIILPLETTLNSKDYITAIVDNFSGEDIKFIWEIDGFFVSNERDLPVSILPSKSGLLKVQVFGSFPREKAVDFKYIKIE